MPALVVSFATSPTTGLQRSSFRVWRNRSPYLPLQNRQLRHRTRPAHALLSGSDASFKPINESVLSAVERARGKRVTASDVATASGLSVPVAQAELSRLASLVDGAIDVTKDGDLGYRIASAKAKLRMASFLYATYTTFRITRSFANKLVRWWFTALLFCSLGLVAIVFQDLISWTGTPDGFIIEDGTSEPFSAVVFSAVFGDGDPNSKMLENQWRALAAVIDSNNGTVVAEQLRPFLLHPREFDGSEADILPVLARFNGSPKVTKDGDIFYTFNEFESTASAMTPKHDFTDSYLCENPEQFSRFSSKIRGGVWIFAVVNLVGVVLMYPAIQLAAEISFAPAAVLSFASSIYPLLLMFAMTFFIMPLIRVIGQKWRNRGIEKRNSLRMAASKVLVEPDTKLIRKLKAAQENINQKRVIQDNNVVYSSDMEFHDVMQRRRSEQIDTFDKKFKD